MGQKEREAAIRRLRDRSLYYDREGNPITLYEYSALYADDAYRQVALDTLADDVRVSTVWLGIDHGHNHLDPVIFETMVFGGPHDGDSARYCTEAEARKGHEAMIAKFRSGQRHR